jgi:uncharacterized membrane protein
VIIHRCYIIARAFDYLSHRCRVIPILGEQLTGGFNQLFIFIVWLIVIIGTFGGKQIKLPVIGDLVARQSER